MNTKSGLLKWEFVKRKKPRYSAQQTDAAPKANHLWRGLTLAVLLSMCFVEIFVSFRGLSSSVGMDSAQVGRELARGHGFATKFVRPQQWQQHIAKGDELSLLGTTDVTTAPLQPLVLAPLFKLFESHWKFNPAQEVYFMDRVVACVSAFFFIGGVAVTWFTMRRLFDESIACWTVLVLAGCQFLWDVTRSGLPQMMMFGFFSVALAAFAVALQRKESGELCVSALVIIGVMSALLVLSSPMGIFIAFGMTTIVAWQFRPRARALAIAGLIPLVALVAWGARNQMVSGNVFGSAKTTLQSAIAFSSDSWLLRDFSGNSPQVLPPGLVLRKFFLNIVSQFHDIFSYFGGILPALLFFPALLHPFRRTEVRTFVRSLGIVWLFACVGMAIAGLPEKENDANQIHTLFLPAMSGIGFAFIAVLWRRFSSTNGGADGWQNLGAGNARSSWWKQQGGLAMAAVLTAGPLLINFPSELAYGITNRNGQAQWPPYVPRQITKVSELTKETELTVSDMPWAVAWYADRASVWLPVNRDQLAEMRTLAEAQGHPLAGLLMSPLSLGKNRVADIFAGDYREWAAPAMRGVVYGLGTDVMADSDLPYSQCIPLVGQRVEGHLVAEMTFMYEPAGASKHTASKSLSSK